VNRLEKAQPACFPWRGRRQDKVVVAPAGPPAERPTAPPAPAALTPDVPPAAKPPVPAAPAKPPTAMPLQLTPHQRLARRTRRHVSPRSRDAQTWAADTERNQSLRVGNRTAPKAVRLLSSE